MAEGTYAELMIDFAFIVKSLLMAGKKTGLSENYIKGKLEKYFEVGFLAEEEFEKAIKEEQAELMKSAFGSGNLKDLLEGILKKLEGEENGSK